MHLPLTPPPQMMVLELSGNQITAVGDNVGNMAMLRDLDLSGNAVTRVADAVCGLSKLEVWREEVWDRSDERNTAHDFCDATLLPSLSPSPLVHYACEIHILLNKSLNLNNRLEVLSEPISDLPALARPSPLCPHIGPEQHPPLFSPSI